MLQKECKIFLTGALNFKQVFLVLVLFSVFFAPALASNNVEKIVYESDGIIYTINSDGTDEKRITEGFRPIWSPDGKKILFLTKPAASSGQGENSEGLDIKIINSDGTGKITIVKDIFLNTWRTTISYSHDGKIYFDYTRVCKDTDCETLGSATEDMKKLWGSQKDYYYDTSGHIGVVTDTGDSFTHLTKTSEVVFFGSSEQRWGGGCKIPMGQKENFVEYCTKSESNPILSPDEQQIAYEGGDGGLKIKNIDGSNEKLIYAPNIQTEDVYLTGWSPDGATILFNDARSGYIYRINKDGTSLTKLTKGGSAKWSPDGKYIAYINNYGNLGIMRPDGTGQKEIFQAKGFSFDWSPDSEKIVVDGPRIVYLTGEVEKIGNGKGQNPKWSPVSSTGTSSLPIIGNSGQSSSGNSLPTPGFGGIIAVSGLTVTMILGSVYFRKNH